MGWYSEHATWYKKGTVDRQAECDTHFAKGCTVLKSAMVGSTYYAAVQINESGKVIAAVNLTSVNSKDYFNFSYKPLDETMGPTEAKCPVSILKLLTETDSEFALGWRKRCYKYHEQKRELSKLPFGSLIRVCDRTYMKSKWRNRTKWLNWREFLYVTPDVAISRGYEVVTCDLIAEAKKGLEFGIDPDICKPDDFLQRGRITTPRGSFAVTYLSKEQMEAAGYGVHHMSDDKKYLIMTNGTRAFAIEAS